MNPDDLGCPRGPSYDMFDMLSATERANLERQMVVSRHPAGHLFYQSDEQDNHLFVVLEGRVRLYKLSPEGRALTLFVLEPRALFGEMALFGRPHDSYAEAVESCVVGSVQSHTIRQLLTTHNDLTMRLMEMISERVRTLEHKLADIAFKSVPQRLASVLLGLADCAPETPTGPPSVVRYTHQQLAEMIGSYRETVTKALGDFRESGIIRINDDAMHLLDVKQLRDIAGQSSSFS